MQSVTSADKKKLTSLLRRTISGATITNHKLGVLLTVKGQKQLVATAVANVRPFHVTFPVDVWNGLFDAAARAKASLSYAMVDHLGLNLELLPLTALDKAHPNHKNVVVENAYCSQREEFVSMEVVNILRNLANKAAVPESKWSEFELQARCVELLREQRPDLLMFSIPVELAHKSWAHHLKSGVVAGVSDCCILSPNGASTWVEFKIRTNTLRSSQEEFRDTCVRLGHNYRVCYSLAEFQSLMATL
ncbi:VRR-NUC domain-containing protein [Hymenobacter sp. M29]|uniref:VRR-NUC domain-containing protein n=1 Tax=Hymenobacter mellowenesis TaxID=3063995 RepID=A0ABT9ADE4_9BACT|nr:VRR-NUC domain-containing protein [Hymenobacter sp. M29]MDO7847442.1 VRR-NUC domain-containing protein [Hymenobacter sp. M29]